MIGLRIGPAVAPRIGPAFGLGLDELTAGINPMAGVARDATSLKYLPQDAAQWNTTRAAAGILTGNPSALHLFQESTGNPADVFGTFTLTKTGTVDYQQSVTGWATKGIGTRGGNTAGIMQTTNTSLPNINTTSMLALLYCALPANVPANRSVAAFGPTFGSQVCAWLVSSTNKKLRAVADPNTATGIDDGAGVRPLVLKIDRTAGNYTLYSDLEKLSPTLTSTPTGKALIYGGDNTQTNWPDAVTYLYSAVFFAAAAELTDALVRALLQVLGWNPLW